MSSMTLPSSAWATEALLSSKAASLGSLEEMSLYVARDLEWLRTYKHDTIASLSSCKQSKGVQNTSRTAMSMDTQALDLAEPSVPELKDTSELTEDFVETPKSLSVLQEHTPDLVARSGQATAQESSNTVAEMNVEAKEHVLLEDLTSQTVESQPKQIVPLMPPQDIVIATIMEETTPSSPGLSDIDNVGLNKIPLKIVGHDKEVARAQDKCEEHNIPEVQYRHAEVHQKEVPKLLDRDYMEPTNLNSPEKATHRNDSAYFSAPDSPSASTTYTSSPRKSIAFASLPPRQPFAKKSLGPRSSQSHASASDAQKSTYKLSVPDMADSTIKLEELTTPRTIAHVKLSTETSAELPPFRPSSRDILSHNQIPFAEAHESQPLVPKLVEQDRDALFVDTDAQNPFTLVAPSQVTEALLVSQTTKVEDDEWLPRFESGLPSPKKLRQGGSDHETTSIHQSEVPNDVADQILQGEGASTIDQYDKATPGPIRAAMQAASAKATSYLRQARTAFGSPTINHTKVFKSTTPMQSPPKSRFKTEPQTPKLYPTFESSRAILKPSMIPSKSPCKSPETSKVIPDLNSPRRSPRRSPKKGNEATHSMAVIAARNASAKKPSESVMRTSPTRPTQESNRNESPPKHTRLVSKSLIQAKAKPLSIRVATASQREIDHTKDRKNHLTSSHVHEIDATSILSRSTMENGQVEYLSKSQQAGTKRPPPNRQIRALAAANQAKEKAEKEQERREQQKKDLEKKRHDARRQMNEEEKRKNELADERKRKAAVDSRLATTKKPSIRVLPSSAVAREAQFREQEGTTKDNRQSVKRALNDTDDNTMNIALQEPKRQRISEQTCGPASGLHNASISISKPVRVSLQKKSLFGHPGEPGYKKPGTTTMTKPGPVVDAVKFSTDPIRFAVNSTTSTTTSQSTSTMTASITNQEQKVHNLPPSELIELPEINSDYSDSEDEEPAKDAFERPAWAETPELRKLLRRQQKIDPDDVFGPIPPLQMEEIFKGKERALARFRPRSSSANWSGNDKLSAEEVVDYARAMGYKN